jgi:hypothetical protein
MTFIPWGVRGARWADAVLTLAVFAVAAVCTPTRAQPVPSDPGPRQRLEGPWLSDAALEPAAYVFERQRVELPAVPEGVTQFAYSRDYRRAMWLEDRGLRGALVIDGKVVAEVDEPTEFWANADLTRLRFQDRAGHVLIGPDGRTDLPPPTVVRTAQTFPFERAEMSDGTLGVSFIERPDRYFLIKDERAGVCVLDGVEFRVGGETQRRTMGEPVWPHKGRYNLLVVQSREVDAETGRVNVEGQEVYLDGKRVASLPFRGGVGEAGSPDSRGGVTVSPDGRLVMKTIWVRDAGGREVGLKAWVNGRTTPVVPVTTRNAFRDRMGAAASDDLLHVIHTAIPHGSSGSADGGKLYVDGKLVAEGYDEYDPVAVSANGKTVVAGVMRNQKRALLVNGKLGPVLTSPIRRLAINPVDQRGIAVLLDDGTLIVNGHVYEHPKEVRRGLALRFGFTDDGRHVTCAQKVPGVAAPTLVVNGNPTPGDDGLKAIRFHPDGSVEYYTGDLKFDGITRVTARIGAPADAAAAAAAATKKDKRSRERAK